MTQQEINQIVNQIMDLIQKADEENTPEIKGVHLNSINIILSPLIDNSKNNRKEIRDMMSEAFKPYDRKIQERFSIVTQAVAVLFDHCSTTQPG